MGKYTFEVTDDTFQKDVLGSGTPVLVDFWAEWCGPCKMIAPIVDQVAEQYQGKLRVAKLDVDSSPNVTELYGVQGIPTLILFKDGQPVDQIVGYRSKEQLFAVVAKHVQMEKA